MRVTWVSRTGGRSVNEDAIGKARDKGILCIAVADGLGGHNAGEIASKLAVETILKSFADMPVFSKESIKRYITDAHNAILRKAKTDPDYLHMSSTIVVLLVKGKRALWAHVGDSRLYRLEKNKIAEVTEDHSLAFLDFMNGDIEYDQIRESENQSRLTNALGSYIKDLKISEETLLSSSSAFLLCTDGWWEYVRENDIESLSESSRDARGWLERMLAVREANAPENSDNYTAAAVFM